MTRRLFGATNPIMVEESASNTVRRYFSVWTSRDRNAMESALTDDFHFSSPRDHRIDKREFFERCWPHAGEIAEIVLEDVVEDGNRVFVRYVAKRAADGTRFRNTEVITLRDGKIAAVDVYFGRDLDPRVDVARLQTFPMYAYLPAADVARAREFYEQKLGFRPKEGVGGGVVYEFAGGTACFLYSTPNAGTSKASQAFWEVTDVEATVAALRAKGVVFEHYDMPGVNDVIATAEGAKAAWFKDTEGNILAIVQPL
jgi:ketosteroid isomerase-like protein/catechol 2,3-dioxygenase-like lactoylglutathione lyase family enzyme